MRYVCILALVGCVVEDRRSSREDRFPEPQTYRVPKGNIGILVETYDFSEKEREAFDAALRYRDSSVEVGAGGVYGPNGMMLFGAQRNFSAAFRAQTSRTSSRRYTSNYLMTMENSEAQLISVDQAAVPTVHVIPIYNGAVFVRSAEYRVTGSGMVVRPLSIGGTSAQVELTPFVSYVEKEHPGADVVRLTELTTRVVVEDGRPYVIMSTSEQAQSVGTALFSYRGQSGARRILQVLTVTIGK
jgi:hypothetical protein